MRSLLMGMINSRLGDAGARYMATARKFDLLDFLVKNPLNKGMVFRKIKELVEKTPRMSENKKLVYPYRCEHGNEMSDIEARHIEAAWSIVGACSLRLGESLILNGERSEKQGFEVYREGKAFIFSGDLEEAVQKQLNNIKKALEKPHKTEDGKCLVTISNVTGPGKNLIPRGVIELLIGEEGLSRTTCCDEKFGPLTDEAKEIKFVVELNRSELLMLRNMFACGLNLEKGEFDHSYI